MSDVRIFKGWRFIAKSSAVIAAIRVNLVQAKTVTEGGRIYPFLCQSFFLFIYIRRAIVVIIPGKLQAAGAAQDRIA